MWRRVCPRRRSLRVQRPLRYSPTGKSLSPGRPGLSAPARWAQSSCSCSPTRTVRSTRPSEPTASPSRSSPSRGIRTRTPSRPRSPSFPVETSSRPARRRGATETRFSSSFALARYTSAGVLDSTFGKDGIAQTAFGKANAQLAGIAVQPDGKIVASGSGDGRARRRLQHDPGRAVQGERFARFHVRNGGEGDDPTRARLPRVGRRLSRARRSSSQGTTTRSRRCSPATGRTVASTRPSAITASRRSRGRSSRRPRLPFSRRRTGRILLDLPGATGGPRRWMRSFASRPADASTRASARQGSRCCRAPARPHSTWSRMERCSSAGESTGRCSCGCSAATTVSSRAFAARRSRMHEPRSRTSYCSTGGISRLFSNKVARGRVISTAPLRGGRLPGGTKVALVVSRGRRG